MTKILFVCHGNICRSPMAEFVFKKLVQDEKLENYFYIESAATSREEIGNDIHPGTKEKLREKNIPFTKRKARQIKKEDYKNFDLLIGMDSENKKNMLRFWGDDSDKKIFNLLEFAGLKTDIADPWYTGNFDDTWNDILKGCRALLKNLS